MKLLKRKTDPVLERARALNAELAQLERQIAQLEAQLQTVTTQGRVRSTAIPHGPTLTHNTQAPPAKADRNYDAIVETAARPVLEPSPDNFNTHEHFNEFGVRKYDLVALVRRIKRFFTGPGPSNPKLLSYLAAGSIQGPRPLRYEKRVARNRFIALVIILLLLLLGVASVFVRTR